MEFSSTRQDSTDFSTKSDVDTTILKIPKEKDSLHKFAISKMLGISDEEDKPRPPKRTRLNPEVKKVDENCNNVSNAERKSPMDNGSRNTSPSSVSSPKLREDPPERLGHSQLSSMPHASYEFPWPGSLFRGIPPHFSPYLPFGMPMTGFSAAFPPFHPMSPEHQYPLKAFADPFLAFNAMRHVFPQSRALSSPHLPYAVPILNTPKADINVEETRTKALTSAFDPVVSKYSTIEDTPVYELDLSVSGKRKEKSGDTMRYHCDGCTKVYATFSGLTKHKQFHCASQVKKEFSCKYCDKTYVSLGALKMHIRTHTLPCKCKLCGKAFSRPWLLQGHIRTHTGEKPFRCDHCARAFADRSNLRAHLQTHSDIKKYSCKSCCKTFSRMSLLLKHEDGCCSKPLLV